jgi:uncharacterized iron-regulated membrane protein
MNAHTIVLIVGIAFLLLGLLARLSLRKNKEPVGLSKHLDPAMANRLGRFQAITMIFLGLALIVFAFVIR